MIPTEQVMEIIEERFPACKLNDKLKQSVFQNFESIADYTIGLLNKKEYDQAQRLFLLLEELILHVEQICIIAVENIFIYRLGTKIECDQNKQQLMDLLPERLKAIMIQQFIASNI